MLTTERSADMIGQLGAVPGLTWSHPVHVLQWSQPPSIAPTKWIQVQEPWLPQETLPLLLQLCSRNKEESKIELNLTTELVEGIR